MGWDDWEYVKGEFAMVSWEQVGAEGVLTLNEDYFTKKGVKDTKM